MLRLICLKSDSHPKPLGCVL